MGNKISSSRRRGRSNSAAAVGPPIATTRPTAFNKSVNALSSCSSSQPSRGDTTKATGGKKIVEYESSKEVKCHICWHDATETKIPIGKVTARCTSPRTICESCLTFHIREVILKGQYNKIRCICAEKKCGVFLENHEMKLYADKDTFLAYDNGLLREALSKDPEFCWCARTGCGSGQLHISRHKYPIMRCYMCNFRTCFTHNCEWHTGTTCAEYDRAARTSDEAALVQLLGRGHIKRCPNCNTGIEKNKGCDHMTCAKSSGGCGGEFCWRCLAPYNGPKGIRKIGNKAHKKSCRHYM